MTRAQLRQLYARARSDERRLVRSEPDSLARYAAGTAADLYRETYWREHLAPSATRRP